MDPRVVTTAPPEDGCMGAWVSPGIRVTGELKRYWEDFHVREIAKDGTTLQLTDIISNESIRRERIQQIEITSGKDALAVDEFSLSFADRARLTSQGHLSAADVDALESFVRVACRYKVDRLEEAGSAVKPDGVSSPAADEIPQLATAAGLEESTSTAEAKRRRDQAEIARYGCTTEVVRKGLEASHCVVLGTLGSSSASKEELKVMRKEMHATLREVLPFVDTSTASTGELFDLQEHPPTRATDDETERWLAEVNGGEVREALQLKRIHLPASLLTEVQRVKLPAEVTGGTLATEDLKLICQPASAAARDNGDEVKDDKLRFIRITLRRVCVAWLLGRPLDTATMSRLVVRPSDVRWHLDGPQYLHFNLYKANRDTAEAINSIARAVGCKTKVFSYAGTKDKRGCTVQRVSAFRVTPDSIKSATTRREWDRAVKISDLELSHHRVPLGSLKGNNFRLVVRGIPKEDFSRIDELCIGLQQRGFINYFGKQRFGTKIIKTYEIGATLLSRQYERAVRLVLGDLRELEKRKHELLGAYEPPTKRAKLTAPPTLPVDSVREVDESEAGTEATHGSSESTDQQALTEEKPRNAGPQQALPEFNERIATNWYLYRGDVDGALRRLPQWAHIERTLLEALRKERRGFIPALQLLHKNVVALYFHAAQSLVWNAAATYRVIKFGADKVVVGDLICIADSKSEVEGDLTIDGEGVDEAKVPAEDGPEAEDALLDEEKTAINEPEEKVTVKRPQWLGVKVIESEEEAAAFSIYDVVLPMPGEDVQYPPNLQNEYQAAAKELLGISLDDFRADPSHRFCVLPGGYRALLERVSDFDYRLIPQDSGRPLLASDADRLLGRDIAQRDTFTKGLQPLDCVIPEPLGTTGERECDHDTEDGCLLLACSLNRSSYLTAAIREIVQDRCLASVPSAPADTSPRRESVGRGGSHSSRGRHRGQSGGRGFHRSRGWRAGK